MQFLMPLNKEDGLHSLQFEWSEGLPVIPTSHLVIANFFRSQVAAGADTVDTLQLHVGIFKGNYYVRLNRNLFDYAYDPGNHQRRMR